MNTDKKIVFYNHYNRGDLFCNKEFIKQIVSECSDIDFEYMHMQPKDLTDSMGISFGGEPLSNLVRNKTLLKNDNTLYINTWIASNWDLFCEHGGANMSTLYDLWGKIFKGINKVFDKNLQLDTIKENYLPRAINDINSIPKSKIDDLAKNNNCKLVLVCNGQPKSNQSFLYSLTDLIKPFIDKSQYTFIFTEYEDIDSKNIIFTNDIFGEYETDLFEISYLSKFCDIIIGRNSGPFTYSETYENYMDSSKTFLSFNTKNPDYETIQETMSYQLKLKCKYVTVPIIDIHNKQDNDVKNINNAFEEVLNEKT